MKYRHTAVYWIKGLNQKQVEDDKEIVLDSKIGFRAILTSNVDVYCFEGDRSLAVAGLFMNSLYSHVKTETVEEQIADKVREIQESRKQKFGNGIYLVCVTDENVDKFEPSHINETKDFIICFDGVSADSINIPSGLHTLAVLSALTLSAESILACVQVSSFLVFFRDDDRIIYLATVSVFGTGYLSYPLTIETVKSIEDWYQILITDQDLTRVRRLLVSSLHTEGDKLRSFLSAWTALEIFINKTFSSYEKQFFEEISGGNCPNAQKQYFERIQEVMKDKYRLVDKFSLITSLLSSESADEDIVFFKSAKKERDNLSHGQDVVEESLPIEKVQRLVRKYLKLHLAT